MASQRMRAQTDAVADDICPMPLRSKVYLCFLLYELKELFFNLDLIQSYGSGIRRAKKAMIHNKSPKLVFGPDNDTDDYTQVIAYINEEFLRIQEEEETDRGRKSGKIAQVIAQEIAQEREGSVSLEDQIVNLLLRNPKVTRNELAEMLGLSPDNVKYYRKAQGRYMGNAGCCIADMKNKQCKLMLRKSKGMSQEDLAGKIRVYCLCLAVMI